MVRFFWWNKQSKVKSNFFFIMNPLLYTILIFCTCSQVFPTIRILPPDVKKKEKWNEKLFKTNNIDKVSSKNFMVLFGLVLWHINLCRLFNAKCLYIYIKYIWFGLVRFYIISTIVGYLMPNPLYTYIFDIHDLVGLGFISYQPL